MDLKTQAQNCQQASRRLAWLTTAAKDQILLQLASKIADSQSQILEANAEDCRLGQEVGLSQALLDRLKLTPQRLQAMVEGVRAVVHLPDPVGREQAWTRPNGLSIRRVRVPLGVLCIIYEARPNVTIESASLAIKSGNGALLRGSRTALHSNRVLIELVQASLGDLAPAVQAVADLRRESIDQLGQMRGLIDLIIPRGGAELIQRVVNSSKVPVLETGVGNCHLYVHPQGDLAMAQEVILNAKCSRPAVCNSLETLLIDQAVAAPLLADLGPKLQTRGVEVRGCPQTLALLGWGQAASAEDWDEEFLDLILAIRVVDSLEAALEHIQRYGSGHTEAIITQDLSVARRFQREVDACSVVVNASTRFTDGGEFGFGAEIGISTQKFHARGPVGLEELTTYKYLLEGQGQVR